MAFLNRKPLNYEQWAWESILDPISHSITPQGVEICYNDMFKSVTGGPTTAQLLVMFKGMRLNMVEHCGCIFAAPGGYSNTGWSVESAYFRGRRGLYAVTDGSNTACVNFGLLIEDNNLGQIVASTQFDPIKVIGVSFGGEIYGYYPHDGVFKRIQTKWGDARNGSLNAEPKEGGLVSGVNSGGYMFTLWGEFDPNSSDPNDQNFNYARYDPDGVKCATAPATLDDWTGPLSNLRGTYCPSEENGQLWKNTWHSDENGGSTFHQLTGPLAKKVCHNVHLIWVIQNTTVFILLTFYMSNCSPDCSLGPQYKYLWNLYK